MLLEQAGSRRTVAHARGLSNDHGLVGPMSDPAAFSIVLEGSARGPCSQHVDETVISLSCSRDTIV